MPVKTFCPKCSKEVSISANFCKKCGSNIKHTQKEIKETENTPKRSFLTPSLIFLSIAALILVSLLLYQKTQTVFYLEAENIVRGQTITTLNRNLVQANEAIKTKDAVIKEQQQEVTNLKAEVNRLETELSITRIQLANTTQKYQEAKPYQERVIKGQDLTQVYSLLKDTDNYTQPLVLNLLGLKAPSTPASDTELWSRGKKIYDWLSDNYKYCGDKGLRVGNTFNEFQFWSPDEILMSDNARCGDCDDFADLFAGMMYASGVSENEVWVVCGTVPAGGHCWNWLVVGGKTYNVDPVCSQKSELLNLFGLSFGVKSAYWTSELKNVDCFSQYTPQMRFNANEAVYIPQTNSSLV